MDINALKERLLQLNRKTSKTDGIWKPKDEHQVRLVKYPHGDESFIEVFFHNEIGDEFSILCPKCNFGKECVICDFADDLKSFNYRDGSKKNDGDKKKDWELFKKIQAKGRIAVPMVERGKESEGSKFWSMTSAQAQAALDVCLDGDRLEELGISKDDGNGALNILFDPDKGYDLSISYAKPGEKGNSKSFTVISVKGKIKPTPLSKDKAEAKKIMESVKKVWDVFPEVSSAEVKKKFDRWVGSAQTEAKPEGGTEKYAEKKPAANTKENAKLAGTRSIDDAFGDLTKEE